MPATHLNEIEAKFRSLFKTDLNFKIKDGIIDFVNTDEAILTDHYKDTTKRRYNRLVKSKLMMKILWGIDLSKPPGVLNEIQSCPEGVILDLPVGTGIYSALIYKVLPERFFIAADYSLNMLKSGKKRCEEMGIRNVCFIRADVGNLPIVDESVAGVVSLNGFHAFAKPDKAAAEFNRVTKKGGRLGMMACCGKERFISDFIIKHVMIPKGYFTNFLTSEEYVEMLKNGGYQQVLHEMMGASMFARCVK